MKKYLIISILAIAAVLTFNSSKAQNFDTHWELQWNISIPSGDFEEFINETSIRGIEFGGSYHFETNVMLGAAIGYGAFFKKTDRLTVEYDNNTVTAIHFRDLYSYYIMGELGYAYHSDLFLTPYARLGVGTYYTERITQVGLLYWQEENWNFGLRPEVGALMNLPDMGLGFVVNAKYNTAFNYSDNIKNIDYFTFGVGIIFGM